MKLYTIEYSSYGTGVVYYLDNEDTVMIGGESSNMITVNWGSLENHDWKNYWMQ